MTLTELIERLEAATEGSRELDGEIWAVADPEKWAYHCWFKGKKYGGQVYTKAEKTAHGKRCQACFSPHYTTSVDSALTLFAPGAWWRLARGGDGCAADVNGADPCLGATPALALCIASLKAREGGR